MEQKKTRNTGTPHEQLCARVDAIDWSLPTYRGCLAQVARVLGYPKKSGRQRVYNAVHIHRNTRIMILLLSAAQMAEAQERTLSEQATAPEEVA